MKALSAPLAILVAGTLPLAAARYHVDSRDGDDARDGRTPVSAWRSLDKVNAATFQPGDEVLFRRGSRWGGQLRISARGEPGKTISFAGYGEGARPRIDTGGAFPDALVISNAQHVAVADFELTNRGEGDHPRRGANIVADNCGTLTNLLVANLFIHDVNGTQRRKDNGGIIFRTVGNRIPSRFDGLLMERNIIWRVDRSGIAAQSHHAPRTRWFPSTNVVIRDNWVGDAGGDGIVPWASDGCVVEHNIVEGINERAGTYNAGIWPWSTDNTVVRLNRASGAKTLMDGQGFDSDFNSRNTVIEFNLSHDNEGGFLLICTPGRRNPRENIGNLGTIARYNISRHDRARTFHVSAAENTLIHNNAIYIGPGDDVQALLLTDWNGWARGLEVRDNLFHSEGVARYGHQTSREKDGSYGIGAGWGPATEIAFRGNRYAGKQMDPPADNEPSASAPKPIEFEDWPGPQFDPRQPERFSEYIKAHRAWMLRLMERQFGRVPPEHAAGPANEAPRPRAEAEARARPVTISEEALRDKIRGGLLGQIIGNLNGLPHEFKYIREPGNVTEYEPALPTGGWTDDDTDFEWVYVHAMQREKALRPSPERLVRLWKTSVNERIWCSNRYARHLMDLGIEPPHTGNSLLNPWAEFNISGQFICETFGLMAPAMPQTASRMGRHYTSITVDGEPAQTTLLFDTMIAMAFVETNVNRLLEAGVAALDPRCRIREIAGDVRRWHGEHPGDWRATRRLLRDKYTQAGGSMRDINGHELNTGATVAALLYGQGDFVRTMMTGFNFGWDADNVTATAGTILGVTHGYRAMLDRKWRIENVYRNTTREGLPMDETITSFADRIFELAGKVIVEGGGTVRKENGVSMYEIAAEAPANIEPLRHGTEHAEELRTLFGPDMESGILEPTSRTHAARAAYLAIALDEREKYERRHRERWEAACEALRGFWKVQQNLFYQAEFPTKLKLRKKFMAAGFTKPEREIPEKTVWSDREAWKSSR